VPRNQAHPQGVFCATRSASLSTTGRRGQIPPKQTRTDQHVPLYCHIEPICTHPDHPRIGIREEHVACLEVLVVPGARNARKNVVDPTGAGNGTRSEKARQATASAPCISCARGGTV